MVGSALVRALGGVQELSSSSQTANSQTDNQAYELITPSRHELDLLNQHAVEQFFASNQIDEVYLAAAHVGGIQANNSYPADFIYQNLMLECNVIHSAYKSGVKKLLLLGSSCIYPKLAAQPMAESELLTGPLELTNEPYAVAKIAGIKLCESYNRQYGTDYRSVMPTNLYGPNDNFHPENSHVIPAMMRRIHQAKVQQEASVSIWGTGTPKREFLHVDDMAAACLHIMNTSYEDYSVLVDERCSHVNIGTGVDCSIKELAQTMCRVVGYQGALEFDTTKPDGTPRKLLDVSRLAQLGWRYSIDLEQGLNATYQWFLDNDEYLRGVS